MSRAGRKKQPMMPPPKPASVQQHEQRLLEVRVNAIHGLCAHAARGPSLPLPSVAGAMIAENVLGQIMQQMILAQSKLVVPKPEVVVPR